MITKVTNKYRRPGGSPHTPRRYLASLIMEGFGLPGLPPGEKPIQEGHPIKSIMLDLAGMTSKLLIGWPHTFAALVTTLHAPG